MSISVAARFGGVSLAAALLLGPGLSAQAPPQYVFLNAPATGGDDNLDYTVSFKEAGLDAITGEANYHISLVMSVTYQCLNNGGNTPASKTFTFGPVSVNHSQGFPVINGSASGTMVAQEPEVPPLNKCTGNGIFCAIAFSYTNAILTDPFGTMTDTGNLSSPPNYLNCKIDQ